MVDSIDDFAERPRLIAGEREMDDVLAATSQRVGQDPRYGRLADAIWALDDHQRTAMAPTVHGGGETVFRGRSGVVDPCFAQTDRPRALRTPPPAQRGSTSPPTLLLAGYDPRELALP